ncbi:uncharacterized protein LOC105797953 [Gossypium raimondii]|uniref:Uncharacterized protein n=1 Tax=Gossypium raimondii TaxID=29730 RepID=A0A0D2NTI4_GOSRA|nr:uncharacterized protein LOC105797953 [Gossypium raimondii]KJB36457.1 hypothetical protein B456_006G159300 [Gossypium raimondii]
MDWNGAFASRPQPTLNSHYDYSYDQCPVQVMKWKGLLVQQATREQVVSTVDTKISGEETVESTSVPSSNKTTVAASPHVPIPECNCVFNLLTGGAKLPSYP